MQLRRFFPCHFCARIRGLDEKSIKLAFEFLAHMESRILLLRNQTRGDDHIRIDCPERDAQPSRRNLAPSLRFAHGILVTDDQGAFTSSQNFSKLWSG